MRKPLLSFLLPCVFFSVTPVRAAESESLQARIQAALSSKAVARAKVGVLVQDAQTGRVLFERGADQLLTTASNTKIVTTAAALDLLGPEYTFTTRFLRTGSIKDGVLAGDLVVVGGGDPNLSGRFHEGHPAAVFEPVARRLQEEGIRRIDGDIVLDDRAFDRQFIAPGWPRNQLDAWYTAPVSALALNDDCLDVTIRPGAAPGQPPTISLEPPTRYATIRNEATTTSARPQPKNGYALSRKPGTCEITLTKEVWIKAGPATENLTIDNPPLFFGTVLRETLERCGITVLGKVRLLDPDEPSDTPGGGVARRAADGVGVHAIGTPLWTSVEVTNKHSQNFYAEQIFKTLGFERCGLGSFRNGTAAVAEFLAKIGIPPDTYVQVDGCGLSPENRFSPRQLVKVLAATAVGPAAAAFVRSLPISGTDGSLEERLREPAYRGRVFAKTGYIRRVGALSGYAKRRSGATAIFSIVINDFPGSNSEMKQIEDQICRAIVDDAD